MNYGKNLGIALRAFAAVAALVVIVAAISCGGGKRIISGKIGFNPNGNSQTHDTPVQSGGKIAPPQQVTRSLAEVTAEIRAYEPPQSAGVDATLFETLRAELLRQIEELASAKGVSSFPARSVSADRDDEVGLVSDIFVFPGLDGSNQIQWNETLKGDFDGNGEVNVADITPVAVNFLATYGAGYGGADACKASDRLLLFAKGGPFTAGTNETDAATEMNIGDITTIALNYLEGPPETGFWGYDVWRIPLAGGAPVRIPNPGDTDAPTVVRNAANATHASGEMLAYSFTDMPPAGASSLRGPHSLSASASGATFADRMNLIFRRVSGITEDGDGWSNGDYYYWIEPRGAQDGAAPADPKAPKMDVQVTYDTPFRMKAGQEVQLHIIVWGQAQIQSYGVNWGDDNTESQAAATSYFIFSHTYTASGTFVPIVAVQGIFSGQITSDIRMQEAPPVVIFDAVPLNPNNLDVSPFGGGVHLTWSAPPDWTSGDIYNVYYSLRRGDARPVFLGLTSVNSIDATITSQLPGGMSAFFKVTVKRGNLESAFSNEYKYPPTGVAPPNPLLLLGTSNDTRVDLSWSAVPDTADYTVTGYRIYKETELNDPAPVLASAPDPLPAAQTSYTYIPLPGEEVLYFFARTVADIGDSGRSNEVAWQVTTPPSPPINVTASAGYRWIRINWDGSPTTGVDGYRVSYAPTDNAADAHQFDVASDTRTFTINDDTSSGGNHPVLNAKMYNLFVEAKRGNLYSTPKTAASNNPVDPANTPPVAGFTVNPTSGTTSTLFQFNASTGSPSSSDPDGAPLTYEWDWDGDGTYDYNSGNNGSPTHTYATEAQFTPVLRVTDEEAATDTFTGPTITTIPGAPIALVTANQASGDMPLTVDFDASQSSDPDGGNISDYEWDFDGDGTFNEAGNGENAAKGKSMPQFTYTTSGDYPAAVRVTDDDQGLKATDAVNTAIHVNAPPIAAIAANPTSGSAPLDVDFSAASSADDGSIDKYEWDWEGDGIYDWDSGANATIQHQYNEGGTYNATVRVTDNDGSRDTASIAISVNWPPVANANANPTSGDKPLDVSYSASGSNDPDGTITKWEWDFDGDGNYDWESTTTGTTNYTYTNHGNYTARLRVSDNDGAAGTDTIVIHVNAPPVAALSANPTKGDPPLTVSFDAGGSYDPFGTIVKYEWDWEGDGTYDSDSGNDPTVQHIYDIGGTFNPVVKVTDNDGSIDTAMLTITVYYWHIVAVDGVGQQGQYSSLAIVNGRPAIGYLDSFSFDLKYVRANDADGLSWGTPVLVDTFDMSGEYCSLAVINGRPAISYRRDSNGYDLAFVRASDVNGDSWGTPVLVDSTNDVGKFTSLTTVTGNPAISYWYGTSSDLRYVRASDANGASWGGPITVYSSGSTGMYTSLAVVDLIPSISFFDAENGDMDFIRAYDATGNGWGTRRVVDSNSGNTGFDSCLLIVSGNPAVSYHDGYTGDLEYARSTDVDGTSWATPITIDSAGTVGRYTSMAIIDGKPAIAYFDEDNANLKFVRALDANGSTWGNPETLDSDGNVGKWTSLKSVNGHPGISYYDGTNYDLKYAAYY